MSLTILLLSIKNFSRGFSIKLATAMMLSCLFIDLAVAQSSSQNIELTAEESQWIMDNPTIISIVDDSWAPINFMIGDEATGFSIDYLNLVAKKVGLNIEYINGGGWEEALGLIQEGKADIAHSLSITEDRTEYLEFTEPYLTLPMVYVSRRGSAKIEKIEDFSSKIVAVIEGTSSTQYLKENYPTLNYLELPNINEALNLLSLGSVDVVINTLAIINYSISRNFISGLEIIGDDFLLSDDEVDHLRLAASKNNPILFSILKKGMASVTDKEFLEISNKWLMQYETDNDVKLTRQELDWLAQNRTIRVAADPNLAPFEFIDDNGKIIGISGEFLDIIAKSLNIEFVWAENENWNEGVEKLSAGEADIISGISSVNTERTIDFTDNLYSVSNVIFTINGNDTYRNLDALQSHKISAISGFTVTRLIKENYTDIELVEVATVEEALFLVTTGAVDAYVGDIPSTSYYIASNGLTDIVVVGETPYKLSYGIGVRKELPLLTSAIKKSINAISEAEKAAINRKWLSLTIDNAFDYRLLIQFSIAVAIAGGIFLFWLISLNKEIKRRILVEEKLLISQEKAKLAQAAAEEANSYKSIFLANMSHEIRTPLNAIIGFSELISSGVMGNLTTEKLNEYLQDIKGSGRHLAELIDNILDISKIEAGKWELESLKFDLVVAIKESIKMVDVLAEYKNIKIEFITKPNDVSFPFMGDKHGIKRVMINLFSNAIKFSDDNDIINCQINENSDGSIDIKVKDNGCGIKSGDLAYVMSPFGQQRDALIVNQKSGTGLGLSIVKEMVSLHGGTFKLISEEGVGTEAIINFPVNRQAS